jgi:hypothetical protein
MAFSWRSWRGGDARRTFAETSVLQVGATHGIVDGDIRVGGLTVNVQKLTTSLQLIGAALAVPAGAAGVYSAYHTYLSPEVICQELRNSTLVTLEKNIPTEAKRVLLRTEAAQFEAKCGEVEPETNMVFKVALQELEKPAPPRGSQRSAGQQQQRPVAAVNLAAQLGAPQVGGSQAGASEPATSSATASVPAATQQAPWPATAPAAVQSRAPSLAGAASAPVIQPAAAAIQPAAPAMQPAARPNLAPGPAVASLGPMTRFMRPVRGWVAIEVRKPGRVTEAFFSGYPADGQTLPPPGTVLTAMAFRPIWSEPQGPGPIDPTRLQGRIKVGECVRVLNTAASLGRQWAEVEPSACP